MNLQVLVACAIVLSLALFAHPVWAQETSEPEACRPRAESEGPWECEYEQRKIPCPAGKEMGLAQIWSIVDGAEQAKVLIRTKYDELRDLRKLAEWFACQNITVSTVTKNSHGVTLPDSSSMAMTLTYSVRDGNIFRETWSEFRFVKPYGAGFQIYFDRFGQISKIEYGVTTL